MQAKIVSLEIKRTEESTRKSWLVNKLQVACLKETL